jgi:hypothetical protein
MEELTTIDEVHARKQQLTQELTRLMCTLTNFAAENAQITREDVIETRNAFNMAQFEQMFRTFQLEVLANGGPLEGTRQAWSEYCQRHG